MFVIRFIIVVSGIFVEFVGQQPPTQPINNIINAGSVTINNTIFIGQEYLPYIANILANHQHQSSPIIVKPAPPGPEYDPQNYVAGAPQARQEAIDRELRSFGRNPRLVSEFS